MKLAQYDFRLPPELDDTEIEVILESLDKLTSWSGDIKEYALNSALQGKKWENYKLVEGRSVRKYTDEEKTGLTKFSAVFSTNRMANRH